MPIFKLTPTANASDHWKGCIYKGVVIVRAPDESETRQAATEAFGIVKHIPGRDTPLPPWKLKNLVSCTEATDLGIEAEGKTEILSPELAR